MQPSPTPPSQSPFPQSGWPLCSPTTDINLRAQDAVARLSLQDKFLALVTNTKALNSIGLPTYNWWSEATHGISHVQYSDELPGASNTALPITTSCSFNRSLWHATGNQIGREGRAFQNAGQAFSTYWAPVINIVRDPRWGRNLESAGEDPFVSGQYAVNFVDGLEHAKEVPFPLQGSACCKHFVANELDGFNGTDRNHIDVFVPQQDLVDSYLPSFQACVEEGKVSGIMCSYVRAWASAAQRPASVHSALHSLAHFFAPLLVLFCAFPTPPALPSQNSVNGVPSCANDWLLGTLLREAWQFDGVRTPNSALWDGALPPPP